MYRSAGQYFHRHHHRRHCFVILISNLFCLRLGIAAHNLMDDFDSVANGITESQIHATKILIHDNVSFWVLELSKCHPYANGEGLVDSEFSRSHTHTHTRNGQKAKMKCERENEDSSVSHSFVY